MKINISEAIDYIVDDIMTAQYGKTYKKQGVYLSDTPYTIRQIVETFIEYLQMKKNKEGEK